jgi:hypothetical protein
VDVRLAYRFDVLRLINGAHVEVLRRLKKHAESLCLIIASSLVQRSGSIWVADPSNILLLKRNN